MYYIMDVDTNTMHTQMIYVDTLNLHIHPHICMHMHVYTHTHVHSCIYMHTDTRTHTHGHTHTHTQAHKNAHACARTHIHTQIHGYYRLKHGIYATYPNCIILLFHSNPKQLLLLLYRQYRCPHFHLTPVGLHITEVPHPLSSFFWFLSQ